MSARAKTPTKRGTPAKPDFSDDAPTNIYDSGANKQEASQPIRAISMKTPADPSIKPIEKIEREMPHIKLRAMSEMSRAQQPQNLGNLAPPYDPAEARARSVREYLVWGSLAVIIACGIALAVWFLAT